MSSYQEKDIGLVADMIFSFCADDNEVKDFIAELQEQLR